MQRPHQPAGDRVHEFLTSRIDYERTSHVPYTQRDFRLDRMHQLLARLGNPHEQLKIVHITGTKGKGSCAATVASVLTAAGYRSGLYSSPHLDRVEERLMIDGLECPHDELVSLIDRIRPTVEAMDAEPPSDPGGSNRPTYFEIITALALLRFAEQRVDAAVLEVGLGGRLDSTNVCQPLVSVITSISYDHTQQLGSTLAAIAGEKAGIIKPGRPVVSGVTQPEPREVVTRIAAERGCRLTELERDFTFRYTPPQGAEQDCVLGRVDFAGTIAGREVQLPDLELNLLGSHQAANAAVAIATLTELAAQGWTIPESAIRRGLASVRWPARIEVLSRRPTVVLDSAHNVASIEALVRVLDESFVARRRVLVFATTRDKDVRGMLAVLLPKFDEVILTRYHSNPRGVDVAELVALAEQIIQRGYQTCATADEAWQRAATLAERDDLVCITGSFFTAAEMRAAIESSTVGSR